MSREAKESYRQGLVVLKITSEYDPRFQMNRVVGVRLIAQAAADELFLARLTQLMLKDSGSFEFILREMPCSGEFVWRCDT